MAGRNLGGIAGDLVDTSDKTERDGVTGAFEGAR